MDSYDISVLRTVFVVLVLWTVVPLVYYGQLLCRCNMDSCVASVIWTVLLSV